MAEVDPEYCRVARHRELERAQDRPVAAQRNHELAVCRQAAGLGARTEVEDVDADVPGPRLDEEELRLAFARRVREHANAPVATRGAEPGQVARGGATRK